MCNNISDVGIRLLRVESGGLTSATIVGNSWYGRRRTQNGA